MATAVQSPQFSFDLHERGTRTVIVPIGDLDISTAPRLAAAVEAAVADGARTLVVDLAGLTFIDSTGLRWLLTLAERSRGDGLDLELVRPRPALMRLFELTATADVLPFGSTS